jgi:hypothetical protein
MPAVVPATTPRKLRRDIGLESTVISRLESRGLPRPVGRLTR